MYVIQNTYPGHDPDHIPLQTENDFFCVNLIVKWEN